MVVMIVFGIWYEWKKFHMLSELSKKPDTGFGICHAESGAWFNSQPEFYLQDTNSGQWYMLRQVDSRENVYTVWRMQ